ncbi:MAG: phosphotransferase [Oscillospiraceae bacterium]|nr:phosphotransferase [Oscillospiraceae bacterium]
MTQQLSLDKKRLLACLPQIARQHLHEDVKDLRYLGGGSYGRAFRARLAGGGQVVLKAYRVPGMHEKEAFQLKLLAEHTRVSMPRVLFLHTDESTAVLGMSLIAGKNVLNPLFLLKNKSLRAAFAKDVVDGVLDLHSVRGEQYGDAQQPSHTRWLEYYRENKVEEALTGLKRLVGEGRFNSKQYDTIQRGTECFDRFAEEPEHPVLIHGDLNIMNIMADPRTFRLTGFIDPCDTMWADREYDLFQLQNMWGNRFGLYERYRSNCTLSPHCDLKIAYYGAVNEGLAYLHSGMKFEPWHRLWDSRLRAQIARYSI